MEEKQICDKCGEPKFVTSFCKQGVAQQVVAVEKIFTASVESGVYQPNQILALGGVFAQIKGVLEATSCQQ